MNKPLIIAISAYSGTGKTTYLERLLPCLHARGIRAGILKHDGHDFEMDRSGSDTERLARAGAAAVGIVSSGHFAYLEEGEPPLERILTCYSHVDIVLAEGFKHGPFPKVALYRAEAHTALAVPPEECLAVISDTDLPVPCPLFALDDPDVFAEHLLCLLQKCGRKGEI